MPFTPLHMGPGIVVKAFMQGSFSLMVYGWAQILMDLQPLLVMLSGEGHLHGFSHTYVGATLIALVAALTGKYAGEFGLRFMGLQAYLPIRWPAAFSGAFIGGYGHVLLDSVMHADIRPLSPFSEANGLYQYISTGNLHLFCISAAIIGLALYAAIAAWREGRAEKHKRAP